MNLNIVHVHKVNIFDKVEKSILLEEDMNNAIS
jgi:hypothetical protein